MCRLPSFECRDSDAVRYSRREKKASLHTRIESMHCIVACMVIVVVNFVFQYNRL